MSFEKQLISFRNRKKDHWEEKAFSEIINIMTDNKSLKEKSKAWSDFIDSDNTTVNIFNHHSELIALLSEIFYSNKHFNNAYGILQKYLPLGTPEESGNEMRGGRRRCHRGKTRRVRRKTRRVRRSTRRR
jgi:hypothetical protein